MQRGPANHTVLWAQACMVGSDNAERQTKESELHPVDKGGTERELKSDVWFEKV